MAGNRGLEELKTAARRATSRSRTQITPFSTAAGGPLAIRGPTITATCALHAGRAAVRDGSPSAATAGRSRHGEHPGARVSMVATLRILHQSLSQANTGCAHALSGWCRCLGVVRLGRIESSRPLWAVRRQRRVLRKDLRIAKLARFLRCLWRRRWPAGCRRD